MSLNFNSCIDSHTIIIGDFNIKVSPIDKPPTQKLKRKILDLNYIVNQMDISH